MVLRNCFILDAVEESLDSNKLSSAVLTDPWVWSSMLKYSQHTDRELVSQGWNLQNANEEANVPSPHATGGVGYAYEHQVGATYIALLLLQGIPAIFPDCQVEKVAFQTRRLGWETDDLLVYSSLRQGKRRKLAIQIKRRFAARPSSSDFGETIQRFWHDFKSEDNFVPGDDALVIATSSASEALQSGFGRLLDCARDSLDESDFDVRLSTPGLYPKKARECRDAMRAEIEKLDSPSPSDKDFWLFIKSLYLQVLDLTSSSSQQEAWIKNALSQSAAGPDSVGIAENSWRHLVEFATRGAAGAWTVRRSDLPIELLSHHSAIPSSGTKVAELGAHSAVTLRGIRSTISGMDAPLQRKDLLLEVLEEMRENRVVVLSGAPGSGKSALAKAVAERKASEQVVLSFRSEEFAVSHLDNAFPGGVTAIQLELLLGMQEGVLIHIESLERLLEHNTRDGFSDLVRLAERAENIQLLITCRDYAVATATAAFFRHSTLRRSIVDVPPLSDEAMAEVEAAIPHLSVPLSNSSLNRILRVPYMLDLAAELDWSNPNELPTNEFAFRQRCWNEVIRREDLASDGMPDRRGGTLIHLAVRRARELRPFVSFDDMDIAALDSLHKDGVVSKSVDGLVAPGHDVLEDWAIAQWIDSLMAKHDWRVSDVAASLGEYPAIRRGFRKWITEALEHDAIRTERFIISACDEAGISSHFRDDILVSVLLSTSVQHFIAQLRCRLLDNDADLLIRLIHLLRVACKQPIKWLGELRGVTSSAFLEPVGEAWPILLELVSDELDRLLPTNLGLIIGLTEDWARGVTWDSPLPEGSTAVGKIAFRLLDHLDGYSREDDRKRVLKIIAQVPRADEAQFTDLIGRASEHKQRDYILDDFAKILLYDTASGPACRDFPDLVAEFALSRCILSDADVKKFKEADPFFSHYGSFGTELAFGLHSDLSFEFSDPSAIRGPFYLLLREHPRVGVRLILDLLNNSGTWYKEQKLGDHGLEPTHPVTISIPDHGEIQQFGNPRLWMAYRGSSVAPNVILCALMALERWLLELCKGGVDIEPSLMYLLKKSNNVMATAVVASVCNAYPDESGDAALSVLSCREAIQMDLERFVKEREAKNLTRFTNLSFDPLSKIYADERERSNEMEHRSHHLETLALKLQFGGKSEQVWQIIDDHRSQVPPVEARTASDRTWLLALHRMDARSFKYTEVLSDAEKGEPEGEANGQFILSPDTDQMESDLQQFLAISDEEIQPAQKGIELMNWALKQWDQSHEEETSDSWRSVLDQAKESLGKVPMFVDEGPKRVAAICVRDKWDDLDIADREWCLSLLTNEITSKGDEDNSLMPIPGAPFTGNIMQPDGLSAYVLPRILISEPDNTKVLDALAMALTHPSEQVVFNAAQGIVEYLKTRNPELVLQCTGAIALRANILEARARTRKNEAIQSLQPRNRHGGLGRAFRKIFSVFFDTSSEPDENASSSKRASALTRERFLEGSIDARHELSVLDLSSGYGTLAVRPIMEILAPFSGVPLSNQFFRRLAESISASWRSPDKRGSLSQYDQMNKLAGYTLTLPGTEAIHCCQPILDAIDGHPDEVANFVNYLILQEDIAPQRSTCFWDVWHAFAQRVLEASWLPKVETRRSKGSELVSKVLLGLQWDQGVRGWNRLDGHEHEIGDLAAKLPASPIVLEGYTRFLHAIGEGALPRAFITVSEILICAEQPQDLLENGNTIFYLDALLARYVHGQPKRIKTDERMRTAVIHILDGLVDAGSSAAYRMRDDFVTPA